MGAKRLTSQLYIFDILCSRFDCAGLRIVVPDCIGYGGTDKPSELSAYTFGSLCRDLVALLDLIGVANAVVVGHDWGAAIAWRLCLYFPLRVSMVARYDYS